MGQALVAAHLSISDLDPTFLLQSYHCYFVGPMQLDDDIIYNVDRVKIGSNFLSLSVKATQSSKVKFHCLVSFKRPGVVSSELDYNSKPMPPVPKPSTGTTTGSGSNVEELIPLSFDYVAADVYAITMKKKKQPIEMRSR